VRLEEFAGALRRRASQAGLAIPSDVEDSFCRYLDLLSRWNQKINLTALPLAPPTDETLDRLILEPLAAAPLIPDRPLQIIDLGSGGGSPAIPLRIVRPRAQLTMVEARGRKATFLREAVRALGFENVTVLERRFETLQDDSAFAGVADIVTARAVRLGRPESALIEHLLKSNGELVLFGSADGAAAPPGFILRRSLDLPGSRPRGAVAFVFDVPRGTSN